MVNDSGGTICRLPIFDMPIPVIAAASSNFSLVSIGETCLPKSCGAISSTACGPVFFSAVGVNTGSQTVPTLSSTFSNRTSTVWPSSSSSGSQSTMLVVNRTRGSSTIATCATT